MDRQSERKDEERGERDGDGGNVKGNGRKQGQIVMAAMGVGGGQEQIITGVPMLSKALLLSLPSCERGKKRAERREDEKRKTDVQAALVQITQQTAAIHITQTLTGSH